MKMKTMKNALLIAVIPLLIAGCGGDPDTGTTTNSLPNTFKIKQLSKTYTITGLGLKGTNKVAIINDQMVTPGTELDPGVMLKDVQPTYAVILHGGVEHLLRPEDIQRNLDKKKH